ncbi:hypothetical protein DFH09DRAFT_241764 [Mycena vulgaris]|nr:hypothetical protein DFH09DRAFT_241764 [Mycena vulgaris]
MVPNMVPNRHRNFIGRYERSFDHLRPHRIAFTSADPSLRVGDLFIPCSASFANIPLRGTTGSGKSTLCLLVFNHIIAKEPDSRVSVTGLWKDHKKANPNSRVQDSLAASCERGYPDFDLQAATVRQHHWVLFDEVQTTYDDDVLWSSFLKEPNDGFFVVLFASYGSQSPPGVSARSIGTRNNFLPHQCMSLRATRNGIHAEEIPGLYFVPAEFNHFIAVKRQKDMDLPIMAQDLLDWIFRVSSGHIGAIASRVTSFGICMWQKHHAY